MENRMLGFVFGGLVVAYLAGAFYYKTEAGWDWQWPLKWFKAE